MGMKSPCAASAWSMERCIAMGWLWSSVTVLVRSLKEEGRKMFSFAFWNFCKLHQKKSIHSPAVLFGKKLLGKRDSMENCQSLIYSKRIPSENDCNPLLMIRSLNPPPAETKGCSTLRTAKLFADSWHWGPKVEKQTCERWDVFLSPQPRSRPRLQPLYTDMFLGHLTASRAVTSGQVAQRSLGGTAAPGSGIWEPHQELVAKQWLSDGESSINVILTVAKNRIPNRAYKAWNFCEEE